MSIVQTVLLRELTCFWVKVSEVYDIALPHFDGDDKNNMLVGFNLNVTSYLDKSYIRFVLK